MTRIVHLLALLGINAVPAAGWFVEDWSAATTLVVYWFENVAGCLFVAAQVLVHQRLSPRRGHFNYQAPTGNRPGSGRFVTGFVVTSMVFCAAHGLFLAVILFILGQHGDSGTRLDWRSVGFGCSFVLAFVVLDFVVDLRGLRRWSFLQIEETANRGLGRIVVVQLTLIFGMFAVAVTGASTALFGVFVVLKTLYALAQLVPQWEPVTPPQWLSQAMNRLPKVHFGKKFEDEWAEMRADEAERRDRNEQPWSGTRTRKGKRR